MIIDDMYPSRYFKCADFETGERELTIAGVKTGPVGQDQEIKPIMEFAGEKKLLVLNKTNGMAVQKLYGNDTVGWIGKPITLGLGQTSYGPGIQVKAKFGDVPF